METKLFKCAMCQNDLPMNDSGGTGYGRNDNNEFICYECCAEIDKGIMDQEGKYWLYLDTKKKVVTNWPGTLSYHVPYIRIGRHNIAGKVYNFRFKDHKGLEWYGKVCGDFTQVAHVRRYKHQSV